MLMTAVNTKANRTIKGSKFSLMCFVVYSDRTTIFKLANPQSISFNIIHCGFKLAPFSAKISDTFCQSNTVGRFLTSGFRDHLRSAACVEQHDSSAVLNESRYGVNTGL